MSELRKQYPQYSIFKTKFQLKPELDIDAILCGIKTKYAAERITDIDGVKIDFENSWVHLRKSNTEPIVRIYAEAHTDREAEELAARIAADIASH